MFGKLLQPEAIFLLKMHLKSVWRRGPQGGAYSAPLGLRGPPRDREGQGRKGGEGTGEGEEGYHPPTTSCWDPVLLGTDGLRGMSADRQTGAHEYRPSDEYRG